MLFFHVSRAEFEMDTLRAFNPLPFLPPSFLLAFHCQLLPLLIKERLISSHTIYLSIYLSYSPLSRACTTLPYVLFSFTFMVSFVR